MNRRGTTVSDRMPTFIGNIAVRAYTVWPSVGPHRVQTPQADVCRPSVGYGVTAWPTIGCHRGRMAAEGARFREPARRCGNPHLSPRDRVPQCESPSPNSLPSPSVTMRLPATEFVASLAMVRSSEPLPPSFRPADRITCIWASPAESAGGANNRRRREGDSGQKAEPTTAERTTPGPERHGTKQQMLRRFAAPCCAPNAAAALVWLLFDRRTGAPGRRPIGRALPAKCGLRRDRRMPRPV